MTHVITHTYKDTNTLTCICCSISSFPLNVTDWVTHYVILRVWIWFLAALQHCCWLDSSSSPLCNAATAKSPKWPNLFSWIYARRLYNGGFTKRFSIFSPREPHFSFSCAKTCSIKVYIKKKTKHADNYVLFILTNSQSVIFWGARPCSLIGLRTLWICGYFWLHQYQVVSGCVSAATLWLTTLPHEAADEVLFFQLLTFFSSHVNLFTMQEK